MKKFTLITLLISAFSMGQFFDQDHAEEPETNQSQFFDEQHTGLPADPVYGTENGGNPADPTPIDDWAFLLPLAGLAVGMYYIRRKKAMAPKA